MAAPTKRHQWFRVSGNIASVGTALLEVNLTDVPFRGFIRRVRADVTAGTSINQVAAEIREVASGTGLNVVAAYGLATEPLDSQEELYYQVAEVGAGTRRGTLFMAVAVDNATTDHAISVELTIEPAG